MSRTRMMPLVFLFLLAPFARGDSMVIYVPGTADPWLAGQPNGATASGHPSTPGAPNPDVAPANSPVLINGTLVQPGSRLNLNVTGTAAYGPAPATGPDAKWSGPDGQLYTGKYIHHLVGTQHGLGDLVTPINALVGVFLDGTNPDGSPAPHALDFRATNALGVTSPGTLDTVHLDPVTGGVGYSALHPGLRQVFFIGDGLDAFAGQQEIYVPAGATRLFLGVADGWNWADNRGGYFARITSFPDSSATSASVGATPEPGTLTLLGLCGAGVGAYVWRRRS